MKQRIMNRADVAKAILAAEHEPNKFALQSIFMYMIAYMIADGDKVKVYDDPAQGGTVVEIAD